MTTNQKVAVCFGLLAAFLVCVVVMDPFAPKERTYEEIFREVTGREPGAGIPPHPQYLQSLQSYAPPVYFVETTSRVAPPRLEWDAESMTVRLAGQKSPARRVVEEAPTPLPVSKPPPPAPIDFTSLSNSIAETRARLDALGDDLRRAGRPPENELRSGFHRYRIMSDSGRSERVTVYDYGF